MKTHDRVALLKKLLTLVHFVSLVLITFFDIGSEFYNERRRIPRLIRIHDRHLSRQPVFRWQPILTFKMRQNCEGSLERARIRFLANALFILNTIEPHRIGFLSTWFSRRVDCSRFIHFLFYNIILVTLLNWHITILERLSRSAQSEIDILTNTSTVQLFIGQYIYYSPSASSERDSGA